jgi:hypothetical protein
MRTRTATVARLALVLFLLCAVVYSQAASLEEFHQHSSHHCCGLCHAGMPFVQAAAVTGFVPIVSSGWLELAYGLQSPHEVLLASGSSRAPPVRFQL